MINTLINTKVNTIIKTVQFGSLWKQFFDYVARVLADSGLIKDRSATSRYMQMAKSNGMLDSIRFAWLGEAGYKQRTSGINTFWTKLYSLIGTNDATQTTSTNQPYLSGNIAPNEKWCLKNPNGGNNYMRHPTISFAANEAWTVQTAVNFNGDLAGLSNPNNSLFGDILTNNTLFGLKHTSNSLIFRNSSGTVKQFTKGIDSFNGKTVVLHIVAIGNDTLSVYINGTLYETVTTIPTNVIINKLFGYGTSYFGYFKISSHAIYSAALTPSQVAITSNFLRSLYPEIPSVTIGGQVWATSNFEAVSSSNGTLITDGNTQATWASNADAYWCHHTDIETGAVYGKLYNKKGRDVLIANPPSGWHVATKDELTALAANGGNALKKDGTTYWTTTGGTNITGFTAIGGAKRNADGTFNTIKNTATFWCADSDEVLLLNHNDNTATIVATTSAQGHSIRLVKD